MSQPILMPSPRQRFFDSIGLPLVHGYVFTFAAGTNDKLAAYTDPAGLVPHTNPIVLDSHGEATIYWVGNYKVDVRDALGLQVRGYPVDNFNAPDSDTVSAALLTKLSDPAGAALVSFRQSGAGAVTRNLLDKLREGPINVRDYGAKGDRVTDDAPAIQKAANAGGYGCSLYFPAGQYFVASTITLRGATKLIGDGVEESVIYRTGDYGDTFVCGSQADQSEPARSFGARGLRMIHGDPYIPNTITVDHLATKGAHIRLRGAQEALIEDCWLHRMPYRIYSEGGSWVKIINNQFLGVYDPSNGSLKEGIADLVAAYSPIHGNPTTWIVKGNNFLGATYSRVVNYPTNDGLKPVNRVATIGAQYGFLIDGLEDLDFSGNYLGGQNIAELAFIPSSGGSTIDIRIAKNFFDGISEGQGILFASAIANKSALAVSIDSNVFVDNLHAILINQNSVDGLPSVYNATIRGNTLLSGIGSQMMLNGLKGFVISGNTVSDWNKYGFTSTDANYTTGINVYGASAMGQVTGNTVGAGSNILINDVNFNQCYAGIVNASSTVSVGKNYYSGIRDLGNFRTGMSGEENQVSVTTGTYQMNSTDAVITVNRPTDATTAVALPMYPVQSREVVVKDIRGNAGAFPLTVTTNDSTLIDGASTNVIVTNYGFRRFRFNGNQWNVIG